MNPNCPDCRATARQNADRQKRVRDKRRAAKVAAKATLKGAPESATTRELRAALEQALAEVTTAKQKKERAK